MTDRVRHHARRGFTAIEILVVLIVMTVLSTMTVPTLLTAMRRGRVNDAANAIVQVGSQARRLARRSFHATDFYGVVIVNDRAERYVALTYGPSASAANILLRMAFRSRSR